MSEMKVRKICEQCGKEFEAFPYKIKVGKGKFCSKKCSDLAQTGPVIELRCLNCKKEFEVSSYNSQRKFCSRRCMGQYKRGEKHPNWIGGEIEVLCSNCGKGVKRYARQVAKRKWNFCSRACQKEYFSRRGLSISGCGPAKWGKVEKECIQCGREFQVRSSESFRKFCSRECYFSWRRTSEGRRMIRSRWKSPEYKENWKRKVALVRDKMSRKQSKTMKLVWGRPGYRVATVEKMKRACANPQTKLRRAEAIKGNWQDSNYLFSYYKGQIFGRGFDDALLMELDRELIQAKVQLHGICQGIKELVCKYCGREFEVSGDDQVVRKEYCSRECANLSRRLPGVVLRCLGCGKEFETTMSLAVRYHRRFCSRKCSAQFLRGENHSNWKGGMAVVACAYCGRQLKRYPQRLKQTERSFCNAKCRSAYFLERGLHISGEPRITGNPGLDREIIRAQVRLFKSNKKEVSHESS